MKNTLFVFLIAICLAGSSLAQAAGGDRPSDGSSAILSAGTIILAELAKSVDAKKAKAGDEVVARISQDMLSHGEIVLPRGTKIIGHVTTAKPRDKGETQSELGIAFDKIAMKDGREVSLNVAIQALGQPVVYVSPNDQMPQAGASGSGGYSGSVGGTVGGASPNSGPAGQGAGGPGNYPSVEPPGAATEARGQLPPTAQGVQGMPDLSLGSGAQGAVVSSQKKNVKLESGTQVLLRVNGA